VVDGELGNALVRLNGHGAAGPAFGFYLRLPFVAPADDEALRRLGFENFAGVGDPAVIELELPRRTGLPIRFFIVAGSVSACQTFSGVERM
jgi:hypothetical protein